MPAQQMASDTAPLVSAAEIRSCVQSLLERVSLDSLTLRDVRRELRDQLGAKAGEHYQKPWLKELVGELVMRERAGAEGRAEESTGESGERGQRVLGAQPSDSSESDDEPFLEQLRPVTAPEAAATRRARWELLYELERMQDVSVLMALLGTAPHRHAMLPVLRSADSNGSDDAAFTDAFHRLARHCRLVALLDLASVQQVTGLSDTQMCQLLDSPGLLRAVARGPGGALIPLVGIPRETAHRRQSSDPGAASAHDCAVYVRYHARKARTTKVWEICGRALNTEERFARTFASFAEAVASLLTLATEARPGIAAGGGLGLAPAELQGLQAAFPPPRVRRACTPYRPAAPALRLRRTAHAPAVSGAWPVRRGRR